MGILEGVHSISEVGFEKMCMMSTVNIQLHDCSRACRGRGAGGGGGFSSRPTFLKIIFKSN